MWTLVTANAPQSWQLQGADLDKVIGDGMNKLVGMLSQQFALQGASQKTTVNVQINGIASISDYARANRYLQRLAAVKKVTLLQLAGQQATFQLNLSGDSASLQKAIALDPTLTPATQPAAATLNPTGELPPPLSLPAVVNQNETSAVPSNVPETLVYQWTP